MSANVLHFSTLVHVRNSFEPCKGRVIHWPAHFFPDDLQPYFRQYVRIIYLKQPSARVRLFRVLAVCKLLNSASVAFS